MEALLGNYYTAISIIIVYHLLSIQHWLDRVSELESEAEEVRRSTGIGDISRERIRIRCNRILHRFPWIQIGLLFFAITVLSFLAVSVALCYSDTSYLYSMGPTAILWLVFVVATIAVWKQGHDTIERAKEKL
jgi:hypothetical protein